MKTPKTTPNPNAERLRQLKQLFPECLTEGSIDAEKLQGILHNCEGGGVNTLSQRHRRVCQNFNEDIGFRVFELAASNYRTEAEIISATVPRSGRARACSSPCRARGGQAPALRFRASFPSL